MTDRSLTVAAIAVFLSSWLGSCAVINREDPPPMSDDGLMLVPSTEFDLLYVRPGTQFDRYDSVYVEPLDVAFERGWQARQNIRDPNRISDDDMERIRSNLRALFEREFSENIVSSTGYALTDTPSSRTLIVKPEIVDLFIENPFNTRGYQISVVGRNAGYMTLKLDLRDNTGASVLRISDKQQARYFGSLPGSYEEQDLVKNYREGIHALRTWAASLTEVLTDSAYAG